MAAEARLDEAGVSLWLTDRNTDVLGAWRPRRLLALVGGRHAGHLDFLVHPDGQAVSVWASQVKPEYRDRNLASVMMDALYAAHPTAWIDHGSRTPEEVLWWDQYRDPAPERNVHNRPPSEWAAYFDAVEVAGHKTVNAYLNRHIGVDGHGSVEHRYGERLEEEAKKYASAFREASVQGPDPASDVLFGGARLVLPPELHRLVYDEALTPGERANALLHHVGHGSLPFDATWRTTEHSAFEDLAQEQLLAPSKEPVTHLVFRVLPLPAARPVPPHDVRATGVRYIDSPGIEVQLAGMSWRSPRRPWITQQAAFTPPLDAAIAPEYMHNAGAAYVARYDEIGSLRPGQPQRIDDPHPYARREAEILALAARLRAASAQREALQAPPHSPSAAHPAAAEDQGLHQQQSTTQRPPHLP